MDAGFLGNQVYIQLFVLHGRLVSLGIAAGAVRPGSGEARWRRWTLALAGLYFAAQVVDMVALVFWEYGGKGLVWTDAITTAVYTIAPLYIVAILIGGLRRRRQMDLWPLAFIIFLDGPLGLPA